MSYLHKGIFHLSGLVLAGGMLVSPAHADDTGDTVANALNERWASIATNCTDSSGHVLSALTCSGVLLRPRHTNDVERRMSAAEVLFLRHDLNYPPDNMTGEILGGQYALADGKSVSAACVRPSPVDHTTIREAFGCGKPAAVPHNNEDTDNSTCNSLIPGPGEAGWSWDGECSLSVLIHREFKLAMDLNRASPGNLPVQIWYRHWPTSIADEVNNLHMEALLYQDKDKKALTGRQNDRALFLKNNLNIPIIRFTARNEKPFSYHADEQDRKSECAEKSGGEKIACQITQDYNNTAESCGNGDYDIAAKCSGVVIRGTSGNLNRTYHSWEASPESLKNGGISFSYLRKDAKFKRLAYDYGTGFIFYPEHFSHGQASINILCGYPLDAGTGNRSNKGCGPASDSRLSCNLLDAQINTGDDWVKMIYEHAKTEHDFCSFILNDEIDAHLGAKKGFTVMLDAMKALNSQKDNKSFSEQNELRLEAWPKMKKDIPLEAFFYLPGHPDALKSAQKDQSEFKTFSGRIVPVIRLTLPQAPEADAVFKYRKEDQLMLMQ